ncbi:hypothetical protein SELMODRAFT_409319 [Selaginella moellendorffii]|uniref:PHD-type domain-containing protein n=1 Tax=Selaginella moellendorffii TaxID=88036 RepID=D8RB26_SELML|nr:hypothetical protein SELMODRAFT_409319 [Selaginella moellendorffii]
MGCRSRSRSPATIDGRKRLRTDEKFSETGAALSAWWGGVLNQQPEVYAAGKFIDLSVPAKYRTLRGPRGITRLYVRKDFDDLYSAIEAAVSMDWLGLLNGNPGVGKSAFLWYFLIRFGIEMTIENTSFVVVYQSADFIWEFTSLGQVSIHEKTDYPLSRLQRCVVHLIDQKIESGDPLGKRILVAASPGRRNIKSAKPIGVKSKFFVHPWDKDEFEALLGLWELESKEMREEADRLLKTSEPSDRRWKTYSEEWSPRVALLDEADRLDARIKAADLYYDWYGGIPRLLRDAAVGDLDDQACERNVQTSLCNTDLPKVYRAILSGATSDDISWLLLHFKRPLVKGARYLLDFASSKIKYLFTETLVRTKQEDFRTLVQSTDPELGALRGYVFEQEVVRLVLDSNFAAVTLIDNKHCSRCQARVVEEGANRRLIVCRQCRKWYHQECARCPLPVPKLWNCQSCEGETIHEGIGTGGLRLRYYNGDLKTALLAAGRNAKDFVWRPINKSNAAFDFAIPPRVLGQATVASEHPVPREAVEEGVAALDAWNNEYNKDLMDPRQREYILAFYLARGNFERFGYQSYRDKHRHVCNKAVKGIIQVKILIETYELLQLAHPVAGSVDKLIDLEYQEQLFLPQEGCIDRGIKCLGGATSA